MVVRRDKYDDFCRKKLCDLVGNQVRCMGALAHEGEKEVFPLEACNSTQPKRNTREE